MGPDMRLPCATGHGEGEPGGPGLVHGLQVKRGFNE